MMSSVAIKQETVELPTKTIVTSSNGNDSIILQMDDESRGDSGEVKREGDTNDRDRNSNAFTYQNHKKKPSSPAAQSKVSSSTINNKPQHHSNRYYNNNSMPPNMPGSRGIYPP